MRINSLLSILLLSALLLTARTNGQNETNYGSMSGRRNETSYQGAHSTTSQARSNQNETSYQSIQHGGGPRPGTETGYHSAGTAAKTGYGLISTRRQDGGWRSFLLGMQAGALDLLGGPAGVAPQSANNLEEQAADLAATGASRFIVDSPRGADAAQFMTVALAIDRSVVLVTADAAGVPPGSRVVLLNRGEMGAMAADLAMGYGGEKSVIGVFTGPSSSTPGSPWDRFQQDITARGEGPTITEIAIGSDTTVPMIEDKVKGIAGLTALVIIDEQIALKAIPALERMGNQIPVLAIGESIGVNTGFDRGAVQVRIRPDYNTMFRRAVELFGLVEAPAEPVRVKPVVDHSTVKREAPAVPALKGSDAIPAERQSITPSPTPRGTPRS